MTKFDIAYWIVSAIGVLAFIVLVTILFILGHRLVTLSGHERVTAYYDLLMQDDAQYMEDESYRREEERAFGDPSSRPLAYYGARYLIERRIHRVLVALTWRLHRFQMNYLDLYTR